MKIRIEKLTGAALDWAVEDCEYARMQSEGEYVKGWVLDNHKSGVAPGQYSRDWLWGGPIIEREKIDLRFDGEWIALKYGVDYYAEGMPDEFPYGHTPLVAAMRCYVASRLGNEVDVPDQLVK